MVDRFDGKGQWWELVAEKLCFISSNRIVSTNTEIIKPLFWRIVRFSFFWRWLYDYILRLFGTLENAICAELSRVVFVDRLVSGSRQYTVRKAKTMKTIGDLNSFFFFSLRQTVVLAHGQSFLLVARRVSVDVLFLEVIVKARRIFKIKLTLSRKCLTRLSDYYVMLI